MPRILSIFPSDLRFLGSVDEMELHGANLATAALLSRLMADERLDALEVFIPPPGMTDQARLGRIADSFLPEHRKGQGALRFYPLHFAPEVWQDAYAANVHRAILCADPRHLSAQRYVRDRYALRGTPILCDVHSVADQPFWAGLTPLARAECVEFDSIVCRATESVDAFRRGFAWLRCEQGLAPGPLPSSLRTIPHAVDTEHFRPATPGEQSAARVKLGLPEHANIALFLGRVTPYSKADLLPLLQSWKRIAQPNDHLVIAGEAYPAQYTELLREAVSELGLTEQCSLSGKVAPEDRLRYYHAADFFVFPADSVVDTAPMTVIEAAACALPVVVSGWTGTRDRVIHGETGFIIPTRRFPGTSRIEAFSPLTPRTFDWLALGQNLLVDTPALEEAMEILLRFPGRRRVMGAAARQYVEKRYSWDTVLDQWFKLWAEMDTVAAKEDQNARERRRMHAAGIGFPVPYGSITGHYADEVVDIKRERICLSQHGENVLREKGEVFIYEDLSPLVRREALCGTLKLLCHGDTMTPLKIAETLTAAHANINGEDVLFAIGVLLKHGVLTLLPEA